MGLEEDMMVMMRVISRQGSGLFVAIDPSVPVPEPSEPEGPAPVIPESVVGYRAWRLNRDGQLIGTGVTTAWTPGINVAQCEGWLHSDIHAAPAWGCNCGIHALARFDDESAYWGYARVKGAIEAWSRLDEPYVTAHRGDVAEATGLTDEHPYPEDDDPGSFFIQPPGFRARYARVVLLAIEDTMSPTEQMTVRALAKDHGADVCKLEHLEDAAKEHGNLISDELLEWAKPTSEIDPLNQMIRQLNRSVGMGMTSMAGVLRAFQSAHPAAQVTARQFQVTARQFADAQAALLDKASYRQVVWGSSKSGVKQRLKTVGPPTLGKWRDGDCVEDRKGRRFTCIKKGSPGTWTQL